MKAKISLMVLIAVTWILFYEVHASEKSPIPKLAKDALTSACPRADVLTGHDLDAEMRKYLDEKKRDYSTVLQGDFNGDKLKDWAVLVRCTKSKDKVTVEKLVTLLQKPTGDYSAHVLEEFPVVDDSVYLRALSPRQIQEWDSSKVINLKTSSIERVYFEKSAGVYYWDKGKFHYVQTSD